MSFYIFNDLIGDIADNTQNPNAQYKEKWCDAWEVERKNGDSEKCPKCGRPVSMLRWLEPRKIRLSSTKYPDRLTTWLVEPMVVSERVKEAFEYQKLVGISEFIPVDIVKVARMKENNPTPPKYYCAEIEFTQNVKVDIDNTVIIGQKCGWLCDVCNPTGKTNDKIAKLSLDTTKWNGEDVFKVYSLGVVVSQRFFDFIHEHGFTNFNLTPI